MSNDYNLDFYATVRYGPVQVNTRFYPSLSFNVQNTTQEDTGLGSLQDTVDSDINNFQTIG